MVVMCDRLQKVEKDHLSQMKKFVAKSFDLDCQMQETVDSVKKHQAKERALTADIILQQFVAVKATGSVFVEPLKFESPSVVPTPLSTSASATDMASVASTEGRSTSIHGEHPSSFFKLTLFFLTMKSHVLPGLPYDCLGMYAYVASLARCTTDIDILQVLEPVCVCVCACVCVCVCVRARTCFLCDYP